MIKHNKIIGKHEIRNGMLEISLFLSHAYTQTQTHIQ